MYISAPIIDETKCTHCGKCAQVCRFNALVVLPSQVMVFDDLCRGCGACIPACPEGAISEKKRKPVTQTASIPIHAATVLSPYYYAAAYSHAVQGYEFPKVGYPRFGRWPRFGYGRGFGIRGGRGGRRGRRGRW